MSRLWTKVPAPVRRAAAALPQAPVVTSTAYRLTRGQLRVLGFHGVDDLDHFGRLVDEITKQYTPVDATTVGAAVAGELELPPHAVWFTFDDGLPSTFAAGPLLAAHGVSATAYVCPGVIDVTGPARLWFQTFEAAVAAGLVGASQEGSLRARLKAMTDGQRRDLIGEWELHLDQAGVPSTTQVNITDLHDWEALGHDIGNHTWDHPCLDTCHPEEQARQVIQAHERLCSWGLEPKHFAYPNGNHTPQAASVLRGLGYSTAVLFDHRLATVNGDALRLSRLRIDSTASLGRARSILSGAHSQVHGWVLQ